jgi:hypothetical protein
VFRTFPGSPEHGSSNARALKGCAEASAHVARAVPAAIPPSILNPPSPGGGLVPCWCERCASSPLSARDCHTTGARGAKHSSQSSAVGKNSSSSEQPG